MTLLITGFEEAHGEKNASRILVESLRSNPTMIENYLGRVHIGILPLDRAKLASQLQQLLTQSQAKVALLIGQAPGRRQIQLERFAQNLDDFSCPDNGGHQPLGVPIIDNAPAAYRSNLPNEEQLITRWNESGIAASFSNHAGNYLCNHALFQALHAHAQGNIGACSAFLHIPILPEQATDAQTPTLDLPTLQRALLVAIDVLLNPRCA